MKKTTWLQVGFSVLFFGIFWILIDYFFDLFSAQETSLIDMIHLAIVLIVGIPVSFDLARISVKRRPRFSAIAMVSIILIIAIYLVARWLLSL